MIHLSPKTKAAKGKAFEHFTAVLLSRLGYEITNTRVRKAGRELDIEGRSKTTTDSLLVECKGQAKAVTGPVLGVFYAKYDTEHRNTKGKRVVGLMFALAGFNSEAKEYYRQMNQSVRSRFRILGPAEIVRLAVDAELIADDAEVRNRASQVWPLELGDTLLVIAESQLYRVQLLQKDRRTTHYILYRAKCETPTAHEISSLQAAVGRLKKLEPFDLAARRSVLLALARADRSLTVKALAKSADCSLVTTETEVAGLTDLKLVESQKGNKLGLVSDLVAFAGVARQLLASPDRYNFLATPYFAKMNTPALVDYVFERRFMSPPSEDSRGVFGKVFALSPRALHVALFGETDRYRTTHESLARLSSEPPDLGGIRCSSFAMEIMPAFLEDIRDQENFLIRSLPPVVGVREEYRVVFANTGGQFLDMSAMGISTYLQARGDIEAGELCSTDPLTASMCEITQFHLTGDMGQLQALSDLYDDRVKAGDDRKVLGGLANNAGALNLQLRRLSEAKDWFEKAVEHCPDVALFHGNVARVLWMQGDADAANERLAAARAIDPDFQLGMPVEAAPPSKSGDSEKDDGA